jgi:predicted nucleic acid-binding protein
MSDRVFIDTNVLVYAAGGSGSEPKKSARAQSLVERGDFCLSTQVLGEFVNIVQNPRKMATPLTDDEVDAWLDRLFEFTVVDTDKELVERALFFRRKYQVKYWDAQIVAGAERCSATVLYSEDLSHQQFYGSVRCQNPFRDN